ncbi:MAG TPA: hypothetical protein VGQ83_42000, partial [Polyangia bacterium]
VAGRYNSLKDDAATFGGVAVAMYVAAAAAAGASAYLFVTSHSAGKERPRAGLRLTPALSWRAAGLAAALEF